MTQEEIESVEEFIKETIEMINEGGVYKIHETPQNIIIARLRRIFIVKIAEAVAK